MDVAPWAVSGRAPVDPKPGVPTKSADGRWCPICRRAARSRSSALPPWGGDRTVRSHRTFTRRSSEFPVEVPFRRRGAAVNTTSPRREEGLSRRHAVGGSRHGERAEELRRLITCVRRPKARGPRSPRVRR